MGILAGGGTLFQPTTAPKRKGVVLLGKPNGTFPSEKSGYEIFF